MSYYDATFQLNVAFSAGGTNIFTGTSNHFLKAVGTYAGSTNCSYEIYIFANVASGNPINGKLSANISGKFSSPCYHKVVLSSSVLIIANQIESLLYFKC